MPPLGQHQNGVLMKPLLEVGVVMVPVQMAQQSVVPMVRPWRHQVVWPQIHWRAVPLPQGTYQGGAAIVPPR